MFKFKKRNAVNAWRFYYTVNTALNCLFPCGEINAKINFLGDREINSAPRQTRETAVGGKNGNIKRTVGRKLQRGNDF